MNEEKSKKRTIIMGLILVLGGVLLLIFSVQVFGFSRAREAVTKKCGDYLQMDTTFDWSKLMEDRYGFEFVSGGVNPHYSEVNGDSMPKDDNKIGSYYTSAFYRNVTTGETLLFKLEAEEGRFSGDDPDIVLVVYPDKETASPLCKLRIARRSIHCDSSLMLSRSAYTVDFGGLRSQSHGGRASCHGMLSLVSINKLLSTLDQCYQA